ncbi:hypothetical protein BPO_0563 [Bergeyella porcorum]|uniref:Uncharacterized protein n=1 Tax=Bergeyella porcorum TaxID=1735111 RepID=A0AAU0EZP5_9FLAO
MLKMSDFVFFKMKFWQKKNHPLLSDFM